VRIGHRILSGSDNPAVQMAARIALSHHERWDGQGYPEGLSGDDIPIEARIVAIADVYDALSHARVYKAAWPEDEVLSLLRRERGTSRMLLLRGAGGLREHPSPRGHMLQ